MGAAEQKQECEVEVSETEGARNATCCANRSDTHSHRVISPTLPMRSRTERQETRSSSPGASSSEVDKTPQDDECFFTLSITSKVRVFYSETSFHNALQAEMDTWLSQSVSPDAKKRHRRASETLLRLMAQARGGALVVYAPCAELYRLKGFCEHSDRGYFQDRLRKEKAWQITSSRFSELFLEFTEHPDVWSDDYKDPCARGLPKDGAVVISASGMVVLAAVKFLLDRLQTTYSWPDVGTRHTTALAVACRIQHGAVLVRSDTGRLSLLTAASAREGHVFQLSNKYEGLSVITEISTPSVCSSTLSRSRRSKSGSEFSFGELSVSPLSTAS